MEDKKATKISIDATRGVIDIEGSQEFVEQNLEFLRQLTHNVLDAYKATPTKQQRNNATPALGGAETGNTADDSRVELTRQGILEFLDEHPHLQTEMELTTAFVYYLHEIIKQPTVTYENIEECYRLANKPVPQIRNAVNNASNRKKWLERDRSGNIQLSRVGRNHVEHAELAQSATKDSSRNGSSNEVPKSKKGTTPAKAPKINGNLDVFGSAGHIPFKAFAESKDLSSNQFKIAVAAYFVTHILGNETFDESDIFTCFESMKWKSPLFMRNNIINHKNMYGYYEDSDDKRFKPTLRLKNLVEHEMKTLTA